MTLVPLGRSWPRVTPRPAVDDQREPPRIGSVHFYGSPWFAGIHLTRCTWTGRIDRARGLVFDLSLETEPYATVPFRPTEPSGHGWASPELWKSFERCTVTPVAGIVVATPIQRFAWDTFAAEPFRVDHGNYSQPAFAIHALGRNLVSHHHIRFSHRGEQWSVDWRAQVALAHSGSGTRKHLMTCSARVAFGGVVVPLVQQQTFSSLVADPSAWTYDGERFQPMREM